MTAGIAFSPAGWIATGLLLVVTLVAASGFAGLDPVGAFGASTAMIFAFNSGICLGLVPRVLLQARQQPA